MLTRLELSNFKTFEDFEVSFDSFAVVLGPNAAGKSNMFDALRLLSALASDDVTTAMQVVRGRAHELFRDPDRPMTIACEVLLDPIVTDPFDQRHDVKNTRLRYEVDLAWRTTRASPRIVVARERVVRIQRSEDQLKVEGTAVKPRYASHKEYLRTVEKAGQSYFVVSQDGRSGRLREVPATAALATNLSTVRDATFLHLYALAEEFRSWRFLQFDPAVVRQPSDQASASDRLASDGSNLARVLGRLSETGAESTLKEIADELDELIGGINAVVPRFVDATRQWELSFDTRRDGQISARVVSDGTIRMTALLTAVLDPAARGLICFEEPENGVHPQRLRRLMGLLPRFTTKLLVGTEQPPLRQVIVNSHSPVVLATVAHRYVFFADRVARVGGELQAPSSVTRLRPVRYDQMITESPYVTALEVEQYLDNVRNDHGA